jgi:hypothetical protein
MQSNRTSETKKAYHPPQFRVYGDIRKLTETTSENIKNKQDGGTGQYAKLRTG